MIGEAKSGDQEIQASLIFLRDRLLDAEKMGSDGKGENIVKV